ncbi:MAG: DUF1294 domain-containing protein [Lentisphaeria bacterium]|nr:DUF1294 domain-containing protein [Lentisphaeria bacterium]
MPAAKERQRSVKKSSSGKAGNGTKGKKLPFPARLACFWPLAVIPGLAVSLCLKHPLPGIVLAFVCNSLLEVLFYREDKRLAERQDWRIPEFYLHFWELFCGWPGALYAQMRFHHKWKKLSYMAVFWLYVILNVCAVAWLVSPEGVRNQAEAFLRGIPEMF